MKIASSFFHRHREEFLQNKFTYSISFILVLAYLITVYLTGHVIFCTFCHLLLNSVIIKFFYKLFYRVLCSHFRLFGFDFKSFLVIIYKKFIFTAEDLARLPASFTKWYRRYIYYRIILLILAIIQIFLSQVLVLLYSVLLLMLYSQYTRTAIHA